MIGGAVALVAATLVPAAPLRRPREQELVVVTKIAGLLRASADVMLRGRPTWRWICSQMLAKPTT